METVPVNGMQWVLQLGQRVVAMLAVPQFAGKEPHSNACTDIHVKVDVPF